MKLSDLARINAARSQRQKVVTLTNLATGEQSVLIGQDAFEYELSALESMPQIGGSPDNPSREHSSFVNVYQPNRRIVVIGAVHITQALAAMAQIAEFDVVVVDPRTAFATPERFRGVNVVAEWPEDAFRTLSLDEFTALVALSHDPKIDDFAIATALRQECFYVGALGSRKTHAKRLERLAAQGVAASDLARIRGPVGVDIGAKSPSEIAVAILADLINAWRQPSRALA
ncbi:XdhC family protein [Rhizobium sp. Rhizsp42]|uniref:XdhC family protein n=1 Tax=Rhizobium sp. Rhizsp42 TaxID=3243034 RepID=UPI0039AFFAD5